MGLETLKNFAEETNYGYNSGSNKSNLGQVQKTGLKLADVMNMHLDDIKLLIPYLYTKEDYFKESPKIYEGLSEVADYANNMIMNREQEMNIGMTR